MGIVHVHVQTAHFTRYPQEKPVVQRFTDLFAVTFAERVRDPSQASVYFLKPDSHTTGMYGLTKEVLLFYSPYESLEARTLAQIEDILRAGRGKGRLEPVCFVLVAPIPDIHEQVARIQDQRAQTATPIPFTVDELLHNDDPWLIRSRFTDKLFSRDFFDMEQALVEDAYFFGRQSFVFELRDRSRKGENTGLYGLRKSGKTSAIFKLRRLISAEREERLIYVDAQSPEVYQLRWWELLDHIKKLMCTELAVTLPHPLDRDFRESTVTKRFHNAVNAIFEARSAGLRRVLVVFDEVEHICPDLSPARHWNDDFLPFWKLLRAVQTKDRRLTFLIAGVNASASERASVDNQDNPLFSLVGARYIPPFDRHETRLMVQTLGRYMGLGFSDDACLYLTERYGGHPLLIRLACSWEHHRLLREEATRPTEITREQLEANESIRDAEKVPYVRHIVEVLRRWYPDEYDLLCALATGDRETAEELVQIAPEVAHHLRAYNLVGEPGPRISINMVATYLRTHADTRKQISQSRTQAGTSAIGTDDWLALVLDIALLRNRLEPRLRRFIRSVLIGQLGPEHWIKPVLEAIPSERREALAGRDKDDILNDSLFFLDLVQIIDKSWERFKHLEAVPSPRRVTRGQMRVLGEYINAQRADAHAKGLSQAVVATTAIACQALDEAISPYID